jgi:hypothetical protein
MVKLGKSYSFKIKSKSNKPNLLGRRTKTHRSAMIISSGLVRLGFDRSTALSWAYKGLKRLKEEGYVMYEIGFKDMKGVDKKRIIMNPNCGLIEYKGDKKRKLKPGRTFYVDVVRVIGLMILEESGKSFPDVKIWSKGGQYVDRNLKYKTVAQ